LNELINSLSTSVRVEKALIKVIQEEIYDIADKEERKKQRKERTELRKLLPPPEVNITLTQLRSRGSRTERVRYNYDDEIYDFEHGDEEEEDDDDNFEDEEESQPTRRSSKTAAVVNRPAPTRMSSRLNRSSTADEILQDNVNTMIIDSQKVVNREEEEDMDTTPSNQVTEMDTRSPSASNMDTTPSSDSNMETSRSQSVRSNMMDFSSRPDSIMEQ
jgi:hypothetical protein